MTSGPIDQAVGSEPIEAMRLCRCGHPRFQHRNDEPCPCKLRCVCTGFESPLPGQCEHGQTRPHEFTMLGRLPKRHCPGPAQPVVPSSRVDEPDELAIPRGLLESLADPDDCWFDHHGGCQAHGYISLQPGEKCPQHELKRRLAVRDA